MRTQDQSGIVVEGQGKFTSQLGKLVPPDIFDAVYAFSSEEMNILALPAYALQKKGLFTRLLAFFYWMSKEIRCALMTPSLKATLLAEKVVFFYSSLNEKNAMAEIAPQVNNSAFVATQIGEKNKIGLVAPYLLSIIYSPWVLFKYLTSTGYKRKSFSYALDQYLFCCGYIVYLRFILSNNRPSLAVVSNDHSMLSRSFALVCRELNVPVAYVQHASVSEKFPKLFFDYAFLDGLDALEKYERKGLDQCKVLLCGVAKLDSAVNRQERAENRTLVSICPNSLDGVAAVQAAAQYIRENIDANLQVCLRPHPGDKRQFGSWREMANRNGLLYSDPEIESSADLICKSRFVVAADSNILLEAALLKAVPISMPFEGEILDHYGFIRRGVAHFAKDPQAASVIINTTINANDPVVVEHRAAKYFSHVVGTEFEGSTSKLIAVTLNELVATGNLPTVWNSLSKGVFEVSRQAG